MAELTETRESPTRAYVIHPDLGNSRTRRSPDLALEEAIALAHALPAIEVVGAEVAKLRKPDAGMLFSKGKREEIGQRLKDTAGGEGADKFVFDLRSHTGPGHDLITDFSFADGDWLQVLTAEAGSFWNDADPARALRLSADGSSVQLRSFADLAEAVASGALKASESADGTGILLSVAREA